MLEQVYVIRLHFGLFYGPSLVHMVTNTLPSVSHMAQEKKTRTDERNNSVKQLIR